MNHWGYPVTELRPGDCWLTESESTVVEIDTVEFTTDTYGENWVRIRGRIVRGYGRSKRRHHWWSFRRDQRVDIERPSE